MTSFTSHRLHLLVAIIVGVVVFGVVGYGAFVSLTDPALVPFDYANEQLPEDGEHIDIHGVVQAYVAADTQMRIVQKASVKNLPATIFPEQIGEVYRMGELQFVMLRQTGGGSYAVQLPAGSAVSFAGVMASVDAGASWQPFFMVQDPPADLHQQGLADPQNVAGMFVEDRKLYLDIIDNHGAGSGEGHLTRLVSDDGGASWADDGCYYFVPEMYYLPSPITVERTSILPHTLAPSNNCHYPK